MDGVHACQRSRVIAMRSARSPSHPARHGSRRRRSTGRSGSGPPAGECLQTLEVGKLLHNISLDVTGWYIHSEIGKVAVDAPSTSNEILVGVERHNPQYQGAQTTILTPVEYGITASPEQGVLRCR
jgi:hypothetical protein